MTTDTSEKGLETLIVNYLTGTNGLPASSGKKVAEPPADYLAEKKYLSGNAKDYDRDHAVDTIQLLSFLNATQPKIVEQFALDTEGAKRSQFLARLQGEITKRGVIDVLRNGIKHGPASAVLFYGTPSADNKKAVGLYNKNIFSVTRQLRYSKDETLLALDLCIFLNGLPVATFELKNNLTKQTAYDAELQYKRDRDSRELLFQFGRCIVHFALDDQDVRMCTHLRGNESWFLPFNKGWKDGAGNPPNPAGIKTDYLWKDVLSKRRLTEIIENYAQIVEEKDPKTGKKKRIQIFPRYHQLDVVRKLLHAATTDKIGTRYLIEHSAGSGKSNSIAWLAHQLIDINKGNKPAFDSIIVVTDRRLLDKQIKNTIKKHLEKELQVKDKGIKVLSLFFIDRVANYRAYDEQGKPVKGKFALWFEEYYNELIAQPRFQGLLSYPVDKLHDGYFSQDKKGILKDTKGTSEADEDTYSKIMRNKEQLLSLDEPLRFIFSHSALREGWDNPNVFQICTLNETGSILKKRQEIGRGLRLPVNQNGERVFDDNLNKLTVIANERYEDFARTLQTEYEDDCGVTFGKILRTGFAKIMRLIDGEEKALGKDTSEKIWNVMRESGYLNEEGKLLPSFNPKLPGFAFAVPPEYEDIRPNIMAVMESYQIDRHIKNDDDARPLRINKQVFLDKDFEELWNRIKAKTTYSVEYSTEELITIAVTSIRKMEKIEPVRVSYREALLNAGHSGVGTTELRAQIIDVSFNGVLPDILAYIQKETELTRSTIVKIIVGSGRLEEFAINPQRFMDAVVGIMKRELHKLMIDGIKYEKIADQEWSMRLFEDEEVISYLNNRLEVQKSVYDAVVYDSEIERKFAADLEKRIDIKLFVKLPRWFKVETPIGEYNPDWAILKHDDTVLYLVRETKGTKDFEKLRNSEAEKIRCGRKHFEELKVDFDVAVTAGEV